MTAEELRDAFRKRRPMLEAFGKWVTQRVITEVKEQLGASYSDCFFKVTPRHRVKDVEGFVEKASRTGKSYIDPMTDITDQVGTRFVVLLHDYSQIVNKAIQSINEWDLTRAKDIEDIRLSNPHHFDYESYHWTVSPRVSMEIDGITIPQDTTCEIQVRTLLQHAYAELAHSTVYKPKTAARPEIKRIIARGAALIETTDGVFGDVAREISRVSGKLDELLRGSADWYALHVSPGKYPLSGMAMRITDAYVEELSTIDWAVIETYLENKGWIAEAIQAKKNSTMFDDPVILLVFWLVNEVQHEISARWPLELSLLQPVFTLLSISHGGHLD